VFIRQIFPLPQLLNVPAQLTGHGAGAPAPASTSNIWRQQPDFLRHY